MMIDDFLNYLRHELRRSPMTIKSYAEDLEAFEAFFQEAGQDVTWETVDADLIRDWMESMMDRGNSAASVNRRLSALRSFYRYALSRGKVERDPARHLEGPKRQKPLPQFLKETEMDRLLDEADWGDGYEDVRDRTIIMTFYEAGIRLSELVGLNDEAVDLANHQIKVTGKGSKQRIVPFGTELDQALRRAMAVRDREVGLRYDDALFVTAKGARMTAQQVRSMVKDRLATVCTLRKLSPHVLRHTFATSMLNHGASIESVRRLLGHESVATTEVYTHTTFEQLKRIYEEAHPRA